MKILLYGGTFDPPHKGHLHLLKTAINFLNPDKVVVMPAGIPPHKNASSTPATLRLAMCEYFMGLGKKVSISDWEIAQKGKSYTIDTISYLKQCYPNGKVYLLIGSDMLTSFTTWRNWEQIMQECIIIALCRETQETEQFAQAADCLKKHGEIILLQADVLPESSTNIRNQLLNRKKAEDVLPTEVAKIVKQYNLYVDF